MKAGFFRNSFIIILSFLIFTVLSARVPARTYISSHRLIVELEEPALVQWGIKNRIAVRDAKIQVNEFEAKQYIAELYTKQNEVLDLVNKKLPGAYLATYINEENRYKEHRYSIVFNGFSLDMGRTAQKSDIEILKKLPGVKGVYPEKSYFLSMYASNPLIDTPSVWSNPFIGGRNRAGAGIKIASMDTGVHKDAAMFDPSGFNYPLGYPIGGIGLKANNNGKIIASRVYLRPYDPPVEGDKNPWPGPSGNSHGVHTAGTAGGNHVQAQYIGKNVDISGVAPGAWIMSYKIFYRSITGKVTFNDPEGIAALEDIVRDGADVVNCSWGSGPTSAGGAYDPLDTALLNAWRAGVFVSMSAGNSGPNKSTSDHPSEDYIVVAATTSGGTFAGGDMDVVNPLPVPDKLRAIPSGIADFGQPPEIGSTGTYFFRTAKHIDSANITGCAPWDGEPFKGFAAVIARGGCGFSEKTYHAQQAGAEFVVIYNNAGEDIRSMPCSSDNCDHIDIFSVFIGQSHGEALEDWYSLYGDSSEAAFNFTAYQAGNIPDEVIGFSSRGPGVGNKLKPDIAAPGVNILSQGYGPFAEGENVHLGFGQVSGTSMAAPHIAGAAALLKQLHPLWSNTDIKSALMSTADFMDIYNQDGSPAQPLDIGAGRVNLSKAIDPEIILDPPSLGFGVVENGEQKKLTLTLKNITPQTLSYTIETVYTGDGFNNLSPLQGFTVTPSAVTLAPFQNAEIEVEFNSSDSQGIGDNQGYVLLKGNNNNVHFPVWARVQPPQNTVADVLIVDIDGSSSDDELHDYLVYYTNTVTALGLTHDVIDAGINSGETVIPEAAFINAYRAVIMFSGDNYLTSLGSVDLDRLAEYANSGGFIIVMGQDMLSWVIPPSSFFYTYIFGSYPLTNSVTGNGLPVLPIIACESAPYAFQDIFLDLSDRGDGAANNFYIDEYSFVSTNKITSVLKYPGPSAKDKGIVLKTLKNQPTLENPGRPSPATAVFSGFGLEGINNNTGVTTREELMQRLFDWAWDEPRAFIEDLTDANEMAMSQFVAGFSSNIDSAEPVYFRWDMGDGTPCQGYFTNPEIAHVYEKCGTYTVRVEIIDSFGNRAIGTLDANIQKCSGSSECFIATAVFGSGSAPQVETLRDFRDTFLLKNSAGRLFVSFYYNHSPRAAEFISKNSIICTFSRILLYPVIGFALLSLFIGSATLPFILLFLTLAMPVVIWRIKGK